MAVLHVSSFRPSQCHCCGKQTAVAFCTFHIMSSSYKACFQLFCFPRSLPHMVNLFSKGASILLEIVYVIEAPIRHQVCQQR